MSFTEKTVAAVGIVAAILMGTIVFAFWWAGKVPRRPRGVAPNAVFLWAPHVGLPAPKRGWWLVCWEDTMQDRCRLNNIDGETEYEGEFILYDGKGSGPLPADQLNIDADKTRDHKIWVGSALVPLVYLKNGKVLIPASEYEEGRRLLETQ